ncbi:MAG: patatin-like phospholipase family protein, partial [Ideonella sp.]
MDANTLQRETSPDQLPQPLPPQELERARSSFSAWWSRQRRTTKRFNLALQGGGAHGAFTWGVLDALLEDPRPQFEGLSGSSAGAMNAVVLANGWLADGRDGARQALNDFWSAIGRQIPFGMVQGAGEAISLSPASKLIVGWAGHFTPAQLNPLDLDPLRTLLEQQIDFERLRSKSPFKLFVGATRANSGKLRVFRNAELSVDVLLASACLPKIHAPVEIDGEAFWDGGYSANPAIFPLFYDCQSTDNLLVLLSPLVRDATPDSVEAINTRIAELGFSAHFMREMRMFAHATDYSASGGFGLGRLDRRVRKTRFHMIDTSGIKSLQRSETKLLAHGPFLEMLRDQGRDCG